ncbi:MAG: DUF5985 family protein, partial [Gemmatimonadaceae bacterium]
AFFLRFWRNTRDPLFAYFAAAFALLAVQRIASVIAASWLDNLAWIYALRLVAFVLIIAGIVAKNRQTD